MNKNIENNLIEYGIEYADRVFVKLLEDHPVLDDNDHRSDSIMLCMMTNCIQRLHLRGWTEQELINEVFDHCENARRIREENQKD